MKDFKKHIILLSVALLTSCNNSSLTNIPSVSIATIQMDGFFGLDEWNKSKAIGISLDNTLYLMQDKNYFYLGIKISEDVGRYIDLYMDNDSIGTINLHASMQLGERQLTENWSDTIPEWDWGNNSRWTANNVMAVSDSEEISFLESVAEYEGFEFQISKSKISGKTIKIRLEIKDFEGQASEIVFPLNSNRTKTEDWFLVALE